MTDSSLENLEALPAPPMGRPCPRTHTGHWHPACWICRGHSCPLPAGSSPDSLPPTFSKTWTWSVPNDNNTARGWRQETAGTEIRQPCLSLLVFPWPWKASINRQGSGAGGRSGRGRGVGRVQHPSCCPEASKSSAMIHTLTAERST